MAMQQLHPGAKWLFRCGVFLVGLVVVFFLSIWLGMLLGSFEKELTWAEFGGLVALLLALLACATELYAQLAYARWRYELTPTDLRIERGIIWKTYAAIPYARVQHVDIKRGILAQLFGFSTVLVQTAGYSGMNASGRMASEGVLPALSLEEAERVRAFLLRKISGRSQGL